MMESNYFKNLKEILVIFNKYKVENNIVLIGSWCEIFYQDILKDFNPNIRTRDLDFFIPNPNYKNKKVNLVSELKSKGYIYDEDRGTSKSKFIRKDGFEVEFITILSRDNKSVRNIGFIDINAECLNDMNLFISNTIKREIDKNIFVTIPTPEAFIIHKLLINENRKEEKQIKDKESIERIYNSVMKDDEKYKNLLYLYDRLSKKEKKRIKIICEKLNLNFKFEIKKPLLSETIAQCQIISDERNSRKSFKYPYLCKTSDFKYLKDNLSENILNIMENVITAYKDKRIDIEIIRDSDDEIDFDRSFDLIVNDKNYSIIGCEEIVIKWYESFEDTGFLIEFLPGYIEECKEIKKSHNDDRCL